MAFKRVKGGDSGFIRYATSSLAITTGDLLVFDRTNNVVIKGTASTLIEDLAGIAVETITSSDTSVLVQRVSRDDEYVADTTNNTTTASNYERMILTNASTVNNTGTDSVSDAAVVEQINPVGAASDKKILCRFVLTTDRA